VDDCRVISGIVHVLKSGCRWADSPLVYGPRKTLYNRFVRWAAKGVWLDIFHALAAAGGPSAEVLIDSSAVKAHRCASGGKGGNAVRRSAAHAAGYKIHGLTDACCRPIAFLLTGGQVADCIAADELLDRLLAAEILHGDKGYDSNASVKRSRARAWSPTSHPKTIDAGRTASRRGSLGTAMRSSACSDASRTFVASQPATTDSHVTSWPRSASQPRSATRYGSGP
jgi:transposase